MSKPDDISHEVWNAAEAAFDLMLCNCIEASGTAEQFRIDSIEPHARAILAERERCARLAERDGNSHAAATDRQTADWIANANAQSRAAFRIAAAIRAGGQ